MKSTQKQKKTSGNQSDPLFGQTIWKDGFW